MGFWFPLPLTTSKAQISLDMAEKMTLIIILKPKHIVIIHASCFTAIGNVAPVTGASGFESGEHVPTPGKPSLKMRLFCAGEKQKKLLCSVFEKENTPGSSQPKQKATQSSQRTSRAKRQRVDVNYDLSTSSFDNSEDVIDLS